MSQEPGPGSAMSERMQSLLSRAVEDQLTEQRQLAGALGEVHAQLTRLGEQLGDLQSGGADEPVTQALAGIAGDLREAVRLLGERLDGVARLVQQRGHDLAELRTVVEELRGAVADHTRALGGITGGLDALPSFGQRIDALQGSLSELVERLQGLEQVTAGMAGLQQRADSHDTALRDLRQSFTGVAARAAQLPGRDDVEGMLGRLGQAIEAVAARVGRVEAALPGVHERLAGVQDAVHEQGEAVRAGLDELGATRGHDDGADRLEGLERAIAEIRDRLDDRTDAQLTGAAVADLGRRIDELHEGLLGDGGLHERVAALAAGGDAGADTDPDAEEFRAELEEVVAEAVAASEQRLVAHVDQAVLALAEVVLRRRTPRATRAEPPSAAAATAGPDVNAPAAAGARPVGGTPLAVGPVSATGAPSDADADADADDADGAGGETADRAGGGDLDDQGAEPGKEAGAGNAEETDDELPEDDEDGGVSHRATSHSEVPWQTPTGPGPGSAAAPPPPDGGKRRPWWRPGG